MGAPLVIRAFRIPGRLAYGCTDLTTAWPHGGTGLGFTSRVEVVRDGPLEEIPDGAHGVLTKDLVYGGERVSLNGILRDWDADALGQVFPNVATGGTTGFPLIQGGGTVRAGYLYSTRVTVVVFTPQSLIDGNEDIHEMVVLYAALPHVEQQARMMLDLQGERAVPVSYVATARAAGDTYEIGRRRDLTAI